MLEILERSCLASLTLQLKRQLTMWLWQHQNYVDTMKFIEADENLRSNSMIDSWQKKSFFCQQVKWMKVEQKFNIFHK
jgi:hypothetical protein